MSLRIIDIDHHRNGTCGAPFHAIVFEDRTGTKLAIVFEAKGHCAVFDLDKLGQGDIRFGSNSWRGDLFEPSLRNAITFHQPKGDRPCQ